MGGAAEPFKARSVRAEEGPERQSGPGPVKEGAFEGAGAAAAETVEGEAADGEREAGGLGNGPGGAGRRRGGREKN